MRYDGPSTRHEPKVWHIPLNEKAVRLILAQRIPAFLLLWLGYEVYF